MELNRFETLVVIDTAVEDWKYLADDVQGRAQVLLLNNKDDALGLISKAILEGPISSLHIVGHGAPGTIALGRSEIDATTLRERSHLITAWSETSPDLEILLYGCDTGKGAEGLDFVTALSAISGAKVAASTRPVGHELKGGQWALSENVGFKQKPRLVFSEDLQSRYEGLLAIVTFSIDPPFAIEDEGNRVFFRFNVQPEAGEAPPSPTNPVSVWFFASNSDSPNLFNDGTLAGDALVNQISQLNIFGLQVENALTGPGQDVSVEAGVSVFPDFTVFRVELFAESASVSLPAFQDFVADGTSSYFWHVIDAPGGRDNTIINGVQPFTEVDTRSDLPPQNTAPDAVDDSLTTAFDTAVVVNVLGNDTDPDTGDTLTVTGVTQGSSGTVELTGGVVTYTPNSGFSGNDSFTYTISDGNGGTDTATVDVTVDPQPNSEPDAVNDNVTTAFNSAFVVDVLSNDSDPDTGDTVTVTGVTQGSSGTVDLTGGVVTYTPNAGFEGDDSFTYTISDGNGGTDTATVNVKVEPDPGPPVVSITSDVTEITEDGGERVTFTFDVENLPDAGVRVSLATYRPGAPDNETLKFGIAEFDLFTPGAVQLNGVVAPFGFADNDGLTFTITQASASLSILLSNDPDVLPGVSGNNRNDDTGVEQIEFRLVDFTDASGPPPDPFIASSTQGNVVLTLRDDANQTLEAADDRATTNGRSVEIDVLANDPAGVEIISVEDRSTSPFTLLQNGSVTIDDQGTIDTSDDTLIYTPDDGFVGRDFFSYAVQNASGEIDQARVTVDVTQFTNEDPTAGDDNVTTAFNSAVVVNVLGNDNDPDGDGLSVTGVTQGTSGLVDLTDGVVTYTPNAGFSGDDSFTYTISDGNGGTDTATVNVTVEEEPNSDPDAVNDNVTTAFNSAIVVNVLANDSDPDAGDTLNVTGVTQGASGTVDLSSGVVTYTPNAGFSGDDSFTYTISDSNGGTDTATVNVTVDPQPNSNPDAMDDSVTTAFNSAIVVNVLANDSDPDTGDTLSVTGVTQGASGTVDLSSGVVTYTPNAGFSGNDSFTYTISDGNGGTDTATVNVTVDPQPNSDPDAVDDTVTTAFNSAVVVSVLGNDSDPDAGDTLNVTGVTQGASGTVDLTNGVVTYTPNAGFSGDDSFTYTISDGNGGTDTATVNVTVEDAVPPPVVSVSISPDTAIEDEGTPVTISFLVEGDIPDGGLTVPFSLLNTNNADGSVDDRPLGDFDLLGALFGGGFQNVQLVRGWTANDGFTVTILDNNASITFPIFDDSDLPADDPASTVNDDIGIETTVVAVETQDDLGNTFGGFTISPTEGSDSITLRDTANFDPDAGDDSVTTGFGSSIVVDVLANDSDLDGDPLSVASVSQGANGTVDLTDGVVTYTPNAGFEGDDSFTYTVSDGNGGSDTATVNVTVEANPNADPDAVDDSVTTAFNSAIIVDVLGNDSDPDAGYALNVTGVTQGSSGTVDLTNGVVTYTPNAGFSGDDSFTYSISDGNGGTDTATVSVTVEDPVPLPIVSVSISPDTLIEDEGTTAVISFEVVGDIPDGGLEVPVSVLNTNNADGSVDDRPLGDFDVLAALFGGGFQGVDLVRGWTANDGFTVRILNNQASILLPIFDDADRAPDDPGFTENDDIGIENTVFTVETQDDNGAVFGGFTISQTNGSGSVTLRDTANFEPDAGDDSVTTGFESSIVVDVLANDSDLDGDALSVTGVSQGANGTVDLTDGVVTYTPNAGFEGDDSFTYTVSDGNGGSDTATVSVTVEEDTSGPNIIVGTAGSDRISGTDGNDEIRSLGGALDRVFGGDGADEFVFGMETDNGIRDRDQILDYEVGIDSIVLEEGAAVANSFARGSTVVLQLDGDGDLVYVRGEDGISFDDLTIVNADTFELG